MDAGGASDEGVVLRTVKPCGPDAPTLASSLWKYPQATEARKPDHRGEHEISRKTIAQETPDCPVSLW
jgi:hypothetical protein